MFEETRRDRNAYFSYIIVATRHCEVVVVVVVVAVVVVVVVAVGCVPLRSVSTASSFRQAQATLAPVCCGLSVQREAVRQVHHNKS